ncbi:MAG: hypothetical protein J5928_04205 [Firmicutes bacterium]|nr:hypothetical protein [Bacillota bacterium]
MMRKGIITFFVLALIVLYVIIYLVPEVTGMLDSTYVVEYGVLSIHDDTTGYLIRNERVYAAESSGLVNRIAAEGDLLRRGNMVVDISGGTASAPTERLRKIKDSLQGLMIDVHGNTSQSGGIVSYYVDGFENKMTTENALYYRKNDFEGVTQDKVVALGSSVNEGYPVFKLVDNTKWYLIAYVPNSKSANYVVGRTVDVIFTKASETSVEEVDETDDEEIDESETYGSVEMEIVAAEEEDGSIRLVLGSNRFFSGLGELRTAQCRIISSSVRGLKIENGSIVEEDGRLGVYMKRKTGKYRFVPINVLGSDDKTTVVSDMYFYDENGVWTSTIDPFDDILRDPEKRDKDDEDDENAKSDDAAEADTESDAATDDDADTESDAAADDDDVDSEFGEDD